MSDDAQQRHRLRMQRKQAVMAERIAQADQQRGLLLVNTGPGKGKSSAAFGLLARTLGHDLKGAVVQFIKSPSSTGEERFFQRFPEQVQFYVMGEGFTWDTQDRARDVAAAEAAWAQARALLQDPEIALLVLDELNIVLKYAYLPLEQVLADLQARRPDLHVVITGRNAPQALLDLADTATDMKVICHAFQKGIKAQPGIEF